MGAGNTATGFEALLSINTGNENTATGDRALTSNTTGGGNTATGGFALASNTTGGSNTAMGFEALASNTTGGMDNTATGSTALFSNTTGSTNTAMGYLALQDNTTSNNNTATGGFALRHNTGHDNTATGFKALLNNTGSNNIALGDLAGQNLTTGNNNIDIGNSGVAGEANTIRIGIEGTQTNTYIAGIRGVMLANGIAVYVDTNGHLGTAPSSARFKEAIKPMDKASEAILGLKPVTFRYKSDNTKTPQFGLIAEEVAQVNPDLVVRDKGGEIYSVRYDQVNAMLLNEFLKEHKALIEEQSKVRELEANAAQQQKQIDALAAGLQKVSAQLELTKSAPQTVLNNH
jgi:hypothetical protein